MIAFLPAWLDTNGPELLMLAAIVAALGALHRQVVRPTVRTIKRIAATVETVEAQMRPNGGASLRDAIDRVLARLAELEQRILALEGAKEMAQPKPTRRKKVTE